MPEVLEIYRYAAPARFDHHKWLARNTSARATGQNVWGQSAVRPIVFQENLLRPFTLHRFSVFSELPIDDVGARMKALRDPVWRERAATELSESVNGVNWEVMTIAECECVPSLNGKYITDIAAERGTFDGATAPAP